VADIMDVAMQASGYDLEICYNCSGVPNPRLVAHRQRPPERRADQGHLPRAPDAPLDLGVTNTHRLYWAYAGLHDYRGEPMRNLRAVALIEHPMHVGVAVRADSFITDLRQIRERRLPVRLIARDDPIVTAILNYYGLDRASVESWGGRVMRGEPEDRGNFDVIIQNQLYLADTPEANIWYETTQHQPLRFLSLPEDLRLRMARELELELTTIPPGLIRGVHAPIATVGRSGQVVYVRDDAPEDFTYALAQALHREARRFIWSNMPLSYDLRTAARPLGAPLHPGAARYCREQGVLP
jgi:TRAP-type uncharacterized transport system substrate-binding protein